LALDDEQRRIVSPTPGRIVRFFQHPATGSLIGVLGVVSGLCFFWLGRAQKSPVYAVNPTEVFAATGDLSSELAIVVDPFVGGGTVPVACVATGRSYIATEFDPAVAAAARARVVAFRKAQAKAH
jgi:hypothetical protein